MQILILIFSFNLIKDYLKIKITLFGTWLNVNQRVLSKGKTESYLVMTKWNVHCKFMLILVINKMVVLLLENSFLMTQNTISFLPFLTFSRIHMDFRIEEIKLHMWKMKVLRWGFLYIHTTFQMYEFVLVTKKNCLAIKSFNHSSPIEIICKQKRGCNWSWQFKVMSGNNNDRIK